MIALSASIMAHPVRSAMVDELLAALDRDVPVAWDVGGPPTENAERRWVVGRRAWLMYEANADWHLVLQDDVRVAPDLLAGVERMLDTLPTVGIVSLYVGMRQPPQGHVKRLVQQAEQQNASWLQTYSLNWGVAVAVPTWTIDEMVAFGDRSHAAYDARIGQYYRTLAWPTWHPWPSLVDHRDELSLVGHGTARGRRAHRMLAGSALLLRCDGPTVLDPRVTRAQERLQSRLRRKEEELVMASYAELRQRVEALESQVKRIDAVEAENASLKREIGTLKRSLTELKKKNGQAPVDEPV